MEMTDIRYALESRGIQLMDVFPDNVGRELFQKFGWISNRLQPYLPGTRSNIMQDFYAGYGRFNRLVATIAVQSIDQNTYIVTITIYRLAANAVY